MGGEWGGSFDESEFGGEEAAAAVVDEIEHGAEAEAVGVDRLQDVDRRLEVALYYRELLRAPLFESGGEVAAQVEEEVRAFVRGRLGVLLGAVAPAEVGRQFTEEEVDRLRRIAASFDERDVVALRLIAGKVTRKPGLVETAPAPASPPRKNTKPSVRRAPIPAGEAPRKVSAPTVSPAQATAATPKQQSQIQRPAQQRGVEVKPSGERVARIGPKVYQEAVNQKGEHYVKDVTPVPTNPMALPMPSSREAWTMITAEQAARSVNVSKVSQDKRLATAAALAVAAGDEGGGEQ